MAPGRLIAFRGIFELLLQQVTPGFSGIQKNAL